MKIKGRGAPPKRIAKFERLVWRTSGVWTNYHDRIEAAFEQLLADVVEVLCQEVEAVFNTILSKFNLMCDNAEAKDEHEKALEAELRGKMQKNLVLARGVVEGPVSELAAACKNYSAYKAETSLFVGSE